MTSEFEIAGHRYRFDGMAPHVETRILKRMALMVGDAVIGQLRPSTRPGVVVELREDADPLEFFKAAVGRFHDLSDADTDTIQAWTVGALSRQRGEDWLEVWPADEPRPAFADINGAVLLRLTGTVLGLIVKSWLSTGEDILPPSVREFAKHLH